MGRTLLLLAAAAAGYLVVYLVLKKKIAKTLAAATVLREVREEVNRILVELNQTTHRNVTLLEDRIAALTELLARADKKIALVRREAEKQELAERLYTELSGRRRVPGLENTTAGQSQPGRPRQAAAATAEQAGWNPPGRSPAEPASLGVPPTSPIDRQAGWNPPATMGNPPTSPIDRQAGWNPPATMGNPPTSPIDRQAEAVRLAQAGLSPSLIARRLGITRGELELILSLAERRR